MSAPTVAKHSGVQVHVPAHQNGVFNKHIPQVSYIPVRAGTTNDAWSSSGTYLDFLIPASVGVLSDTKLRFDINNTGSSLLCPATSYWVQQIEVFVGSQQIEVLYPNDIHNETVGFKSNDELAAVASVINNSATDYSLGATVPAGTNSYYLPFNNCLTEARLYVHGVKEDVYFRVYFPASMFPSTFKLSSAALVITEDVGSSADKGRHKPGHESGIIYNTVVRQRQMITYTKPDSTSDSTIDLTGLYGNSAGLVVYAGPSVVPGTGTSTNPYNRAGAAVPTNSLLNLRFPLKTLELDDQLGKKITEQLKGPALKAFTWWTQVGTQYAANTNVNTYLIPFCSNFRAALEDGNNHGYLPMDNTNRLVINAALADVVAANPSSETWVLTITNYVYNQLVFQNGKLANVIKK